jgi:multiple sugar transport system permease protein
MKLVSYLILGIWALVCAFPLYWVAVTSLKGEFEIVHGPFYLPFVDFSPSLGAWEFVVSDPQESLILQFFNSVVVATSAAALTVLLGGMVVYGLTRFPSVPARTVAALPLAGAAVVGALLSSITMLALAAFAVAILLVAKPFRPRNLPLPKNAILFAIIATRILPPVIVVLPIYEMARRTGLLDTRTLLILVYAASNLPVAVWLLRPVFGEAATDQEEAAQLDGASQLRIFSTILVPMTAGRIAAVGLLIFVLSWNEYLFAVYLAASHAMTLPPWVVGQMSIREAQAGGDIVEWSRLSAAIIIMFAPLLLFTVAALRLVGRVGTGLADQRRIDVRTGA